MPDEILSHYWKCFHTPEGMEVLRDLKNNFFNSVMVNEECNPNQLLVREGRRGTVIYIMSMIESFEIEYEKERREKENNG